MALESRFLGLVQNARAIGMEINCSKTQLLCLSPRNGCDTVAVIATPEGPVHSVDELKLVGFVFGKEPDVSAHIDHLIARYGIRVWLLHHLREAGIKNDKLCQLYYVYVRSILEYCSPVYHSMVTRGQAETLERLQRHAARVCYGTQRPIEQVMAEVGMETLEARRIARIDRFVAKTVNDPRFGPAWYPRRPADRFGLRGRREIVEKRTKSVRLYNSPRNFFARRANELGFA